MSGAPAPWRGGRLGVVMMSALGDAVHVLPLLDALKTHAPSTHVTWILQPGAAALVSGHPHVDDTVIFRRDQGLRGYRDLRRALDDRPPFDLVLALQVYLKAGVVTALTRSPVKLGFDRRRARDLNWLFTTHRIPPHQNQHVQDQYFEFLDALGVPHGEPRWGLEPSFEERVKAAAIIGTHDGPVVGLVVGSSKPAKNWFPDRYAELAERLVREHGARCVVLGARTDYEDQVARAITRHAGTVNALGSGVRGLVGLIDACDVIVSPDTGPFHMSVAMNVPAVGLFGYTNPKRVGPYRRFGELLVDAYGDPGENYPISPEYRAGRMQRISVEMVLEKVKLALRR